MKVQGEAGPRACECQGWTVLGPHWAGGSLTPVPYSFLVAHTLGRRMLYPGSVYLLQKALMPVLLQGQARLVEEVRLACPCPSTALLPLKDVVSCP